MQDGFDLFGQDFFFSFFKMPDLHIDIGQMSTIEFTKKINLSVMEGGVGQPALSLDLGPFDLKAKSGVQQGDENSNHASIDFGLTLTGVSFHTEVLLQPGASNNFNQISDRFPLEPARTLKVKLQDSALNMDKKGMKIDLRVLHLPKLELAYG